ncbi:MAG: hypothetical protein AABZ57_06155 [Candidatus Margulisiibacteriota bacterium]
MILRKFTSLFLIIALFACACFAENITAGSKNDGVKHIYVENGVSTVIITADKANFEKEADVFRAGRIEYAVLWGVIVGGIIIYFGSRGR